MVKKKKRVNISVDADFWKDWQELAKSVGLSASGMIEFTGRAMIDSSKGLVPVMDHLLNLGAKVEKPKRGRKK